MIEKTIASRRIYEGRAVNLRVDTVETPDGRRTTREIVEHADCIAVVPVDVKDNVLLVKQYRKAAEKELLEIPAGGIEPGEDPVTAVAREMREETGLLPRKIEPLGGFYSAPGYTTEYLYLYLATDMVPMPLTAEDTAEIEVIPVPRHHIPKMITDGIICDSKSIAGLLRYLYVVSRK
jgi:ADP-ribose pyrophosphatase